MLTKIYCFLLIIALAKQLLAFKLLRPTDKIFHNQLSYQNEKGNLINSNQFLYDDNDQLYNAFDSDEASNVCISIQIILSLIVKTTQNLRENRIFVQQTGPL